MPTLRNRTPSVNKAASAYVLTAETGAFDLAGIDAAFVKQGWDLRALGTLVTDVATNNITLVEPTGAAAGDLLVACIAYRSAAGGSDFTVPANWTLIQQNRTDNTSTTAASGIGSGLMAYIIRAGSAPSYVFTRSAGADVAIGRVIAYKGAKSAGTLEASSVVTAGASSVTASTTTITPATDHSLIVAMVAGGCDTTASGFDAATAPSVASGATDTTTPPSVDTWEERQDSLSAVGSDTTLAIADAVKASTAATGTISATMAVASRHVMIAAAFKLSRVVNYTMAADTGAFALAGQAVTLRQGHVLAAGAGSFALAGQATTLTFTPVAQIYYVDVSTGSDSDDGKTPTNAWQTIAKVNGSTFAAGDSVLFQGGQTFSGALVVPSSGTVGRPITYGSFGTGRATISSGNSAIGIAVTNRSYVTVRDFICVGGGITTSTTEGIKVDNSQAGNTKLPGILIANCDVSAYGQSGITLSGSVGHSGFSDAIIEDCVSHGNTGRTATSGTAGINVWGNDYGIGAASPSHTGLIIRRCTAYGNTGTATGATSSTGNGIILGQCSDALVENCTAYDNGANNTYASGPVGIWSYDSLRTIIQFCESYNNKTNSHTDGGGFDLDGGSKDCIIQYCYSHGNMGYGFLLNAATVTTYDNNTIRYCISENDGVDTANTICSGISLGHYSPSALSNIKVYGNTIYQNYSSTVACLAIAGDTTASTLTGRIANNIFIGGSNSSFLINSISINPTNLLFTGNDWYTSGASFKMRWNGTTHTTFAAWQTATGQEKISGANVGLTSNPLLVSPGAGGTVNDNTPGALATALSEYKLQSSSPMIGAGRNLLSEFSIDAGGRDFFGNTVPIGAYDVGAHELVAAVTMAAGTGAFALAGQPAVFNVTLPISVGAFSVTGQAVTLRQGYAVTAAAGAFALAGQATTLRQGYAVTASAGSYALAGQAVILGTGLPAAVGAFALAGQSVTLTKAGAKTISADAGAYALAGQAVTLRQAHVITAAAGVFALAGQAVTLRQAHVVKAAAGAFALAGQAVILRHGYAVVAGAGAYTLAGQAVTLTSSHVGARVLAAGAAAYALAGQAATFGIGFPASTGTFAFTGQPAIFGIGLPISTGAFAFAGQSAILTTSHVGAKVLGAGTGIFALAGQPATLRQAHIAPEGAGAFALAGQAAALRHGYAVTATFGSYALAGQVATFGITMPAGTGAFLFSGKPIATIMAAGRGAFSFTGNPVTLTKTGAFGLVCSTGAYALAGQSVTLRRARLPLTASAGPFALAGQAAILRQGYVVQLAAGAFTFAGQVTRLAMGRRLLAAPAAFAFAGQPAVGRRGLRLIAGVSALLTAGQAAALSRIRRIVATPAALALAGQPIVVSRTRRLIAAKGSYLFVPQAVRIGINAQTMEADGRAFVISNPPVTFKITARLAPGAYVIAGSASLVIRGAPSARWMQARADVAANLVGAWVPAAALVAQNDTAEILIAQADTGSSAIGSVRP